MCNTVPRGITLGADGKDCRRLAYPAVVFPVAKAYCPRVKGLLQQSCQSSRPQSYWCAQRRCIAQKQQKVRLNAAKNDILPISPEEFWSPTGVPLVDELGSFSTVQGAAVEAMKLVGLALIGVFVAVRFVNLIGRLGCSTEEEGKKGPFNLLRSFVAAASVPVAKLLPVYGSVYAATVVSALVQVSLTKKPFRKIPLMEFILEHCDGMLGGMRVMTQLIQDTSEVILIIGAAWTLANLKDRLFSLIINTMLGGERDYGLGRILGTLSNIVNFGIYLAAMFAMLIACGINITPIIASFGGASIVAGLALQNILGNIASAMTLYAAPPFNVGNHIKLLNNGNLIAEGSVMALEPLRTVLRTKTGTTVYINNAAVVNYIVENSSQKQ